ncbi:MAG: hypothetical protein F6J99_03730 [Moorea sp. SIO4G3]|nr:hypothetical protein [Moorena sp. SIO4G3]
MIRDCCSYLHYLVEQASCLSLILLTLPASLDRGVSNGSSNDKRFPIPDSRFPIPDSRFPIPDSLFPHDN